MLNIQKSVDIKFNNILHVLQVEAKECVLLVKLRNKSTNAEYTGSFTLEYIQEMTRKTGNYKKFSVFLEMLMSTMENESGPVMLDLLQGKELTNIQGKSKGDKVYLVVTYAVAFDR
jgi:coiled-coil domain-containing protein 61